MAGERRETCHWMYSDWPESESDFSGECGAEWSFTDGGLVENSMRYCPQCGGLVVFESPEDTGEESADA